MLLVEPGDPTAPKAKALLQASHALMQELYPPECNYFLSVEALCGPGIHFYVAREGADVLGTGALVNHGDYGEVKSMFTAERARGKGVGAALLRQLEDHARALELPLLRLETGEELASALRLYMRHGFTRCGIFGAYQPNHTSVYMEKPL